MIAVAAVLPAWAVDRLAEADSAYNAKNYEHAVSLYRAVIEEKGENAQLLFDLGNAYYQMGDYGGAMLSYLRAHRLDPSLPELNSNLRYLQSRVEDANKAEQKGKRLKVSADEPSFFSQVHTAVARNVHPDTWAWIAASFFILFVGCVAVYIFTRRVLWRKLGFFGGIASLGVSVIFLIFAIMGAAAFNNSDEGVVTAFKETLATEPGKTPESGHGAVLTRGSVVRIVSEESDADGNVSWYKVRLNSDYIGWLPASSLTPLRDN